MNYLSFGVRDDRHTITSQARYCSLVMH